MTWLENTRDLGDIIIPVIFFGVVGTIYLRGSLRRQREQEALADRYGLGTHDDLPDDFPVAILDSFGRWKTGDNLVGHRGSDLLLTFDCEIVPPWGQKGGSIFTVVAIRTGEKHLHPRLPESTFYRHSGAWRIAIARFPLIYSRRRLGPKQIEELWRQLAPSS